MKSDSAIKVELVDDKEIGKGDLPDRSVKAFVNKTELNSLVDGQGGGDCNVVLLENYIDIVSGKMNDVEYIKQCVEEGKAFYWNVPDEFGGDMVDALFHGKIEGENIILSGNADLVARDSGDEYVLYKYTFAFDKTTGVLDMTNMGAEVFALRVLSSAGGVKTLGLPTLYIDVNGTTYEYNGTQDVSINI